MLKLSEWATQPLAGSWGHKYQAGGLNVGQLPAMQQSAVVPARQQLAIVPATQQLAVVYGSLCTPAVLLKIQRWCVD